MCRVVAPFRRRSSLIPSIFIVTCGFFMFKAGVVARLRSIVVAVVLLLMPFSTSPAQSGPWQRHSCSVSLRSGRWRTSGGNFFWLECAGTQLFWLGMNNARNRSHRGAMWTQVGHGVIQGSRIDLFWSDVPYGTIRTFGRIQLRVDADTVLRVVRDGRPFSASEMRWVAET